MGHSPLHNKKLYGTATVGSKGQIVIPADARDELGIASGDRLYVVGSVENGFLGLLKEETLEQVVEQLTKQVETFRALKQTKDKN